MIKLLKVVDGIEYYLIGEEGLDKIMELEEKAFPPELRAPKQALREMIQFFPEGLFIATKDGTPVGYFLNVLVDDEYVEQLEEFLISSPFLPVPKQKGKNLLHESIGITIKGQSIAKELILCTKEIVEKYKVKRLVAVLETEAGNKLTQKLGFLPKKTVEMPHWKAKIKMRSPEGFFELVRKAL